MSAVHKRASEEIVGLPGDTSDEDAEAWQDRHEKRLKEALQAEMRRGDPETDSV